VAEEMTEELVDIINPKDKPKSVLPYDKHRKKRNELLYRKMLHGKFYHLSEKEKQLV
jgi:hypothetical protein